MNKTNKQCFSPYVGCYHCMVSFCTVIIWLHYADNSVCTLIFTVRCYIEKKWKSPLMKSLSCAIPVEIILNELSAYTPPKKCNYWPNQKDDWSNEKGRTASSWNVSLLWAACLCSSEVGHIIWSLCCSHTHFQFLFKHCLWVWPKWQTMTESVAGEKLILSGSDCKMVCTASSCWVNHHKDI